MPYYLLQIAFTPATAAALRKNPESRLEALRPAVENLGGNLEDGWIAFGEYDAVLLLQMPDNVSAAAFSVAISAGDAVKTLKTTPLMTVREGTEAAQRAFGEGDAVLPLSDAHDASDMTPQQVQELVAPNLEYAATCAESAYEILKEMGIQDTLPAVDRAITNGVHFLQLAQHYLEELQRQMREAPADGHNDAAESEGEDELRPVERLSV